MKDFIYFLYTHTHNFIGLVLKRAPGDRGKMLDWLSL